MTFENVATQHKETVAGDLVVFSMAEEEAAASTMVAVMDGRGGDYISKRRIKWSR